MEITNKENKIDYIKTIFAHNQGLIELADNKANIILGINTILIPIIFGVSGINFSDLINNNLLYNVFTQNYLINAFILNTCVIISLFFLGLSFIFSVSVIKARLLDENDNQIFFKNIIKYTFEEYQKIINETTVDGIIENYLKEIYSLAKINDKKYAKYRFALWFLIFGVISLFSGFILINFLNYNFISNFKYLLLWLLIFKN